MSQGPPHPRELDPRRRLGALGERLAAEHLLRRGYTILERNFRTRWGELDLVAFDGSALIFCEVKARRARGGAAEVPEPEALDSVGPRKRAQVRSMALSWLGARPDRPFAESLRFDAIGVTLDADGSLRSLEHLEDAF